MLIDKQHFIQAINFIIELGKKELELTKALQSYGGETDFMSFRTDHSTRIVDWLEEVSNDKDHYISWWLWDCPEVAKTKNEEAYTVWLPDGAKKVLSLPEDLFDFLEAQNA